jgi:hypothetical protein
LWMWVFMEASGIRLLQRLCVRENVSYFPFGCRGPRDSVRQIGRQRDLRLVSSDVTLSGNAIHSLFRRGNFEARNSKSASFSTLEIPFGTAEILGIFGPSGKSPAWTISSPRVQWKRSRRSRLTSSDSHRAITSDGAANRDCFLAIFARFVNKQEVFNGDGILGQSTNSAGKLAISEGTTALLPGQSRDQTETNRTGTQTDILKTDSANQTAASA